MTMRGLILPRLEVTEHLRRLAAEEVHLVGHQVRHGGRAALVRHVADAGAGLLLEIDAADVRAAAGADVRHGRLVGIRLEPGDQLLAVRSPGSPVRPTMMSVEVESIAIGSRSVTGCHGTG